MKKLTVFGLPLNPAHLLNELDGASFCVSYHSRKKLGKQLMQAMDLVDRDGLFLIDNGAFSNWMSNKKKGDDSKPSFDHWIEFGEWASGLMSYCDQAVAVIPDVIDGTEQENRDLLEQFVAWAEWRGGCIGLIENLMPVWHMHESLYYLDSLLDRFKYVAIGSSGEFAKIGTDKWHKRIEQALEQVKESRESGAANVHIHMMRAQSMADRYEFDSADSCNVAVNHGRYKSQGEGHVKAFADRVQKPIDDSCDGIADHDTPATIFNDLCDQNFAAITDGYFARQ